MKQKIFSKILLTIIIWLFICSSAAFADGSIIAPEKPILTTSQFANYTLITLSATGGATIYYTTDRSAPTLDSPVYKNSFSVSRSTNPYVITIQSIAVLNGVSSEVLISEIFIVPTGSSGGGHSTPTPTPTISKIGFLTSDGTEINEIGNNTAIRGYVDIDNINRVEKSNIGSFFVACYVDGKLHSTRTFTASIDSNTLSKRVTTDIIDIPYTNKDIKFKICAWDSFGNMKPLIPFQTIGLSIIASNGLAVISGTPSATNTDGDTVTKITTLQNNSDVPTIDSTEIPIFKPNIFPIPN